jgi:hypothetical protein
MDTFWLYVRPGSNLKRAGTARARTLEIIAFNLERTGARSEYPIY